MVDERGVVSRALGVSGKFRCRVPLFLLGGQIGLVTTKDIHSMSHSILYEAEYAINRMGSIGSWNGPLQPSYTAAVEAAAP